MSKVSSIRSPKTLHLANRKNSRPSIVVGPWEGCRCMGEAAAAAATSAPWGLRPLLTLPVAAGPTGLGPFCPVPDGLLLLPACKVGLIQANLSCLQGGAAGQLMAGRCQLPDKSHNNVVNPQRMFHRGILRFLHYHTSISNVHVTLMSVRVSCSK